MDQDGIIRIRIDKTTHFNFSGGETHFKWKPNGALPLLDWGYPVEIICLDYTAAGFMALCEHAEILRRYGAKKIDLTYPYLPYARQDRVIHWMEPFSLRTFCQLLNSQRFDSVTVWDPHSDVGPALIDNCRVVPQTELAARALANYWADKDTLFISPDAGAHKKLCKLMPDDNRIAIGVKKRGEKGKILHTDVFSPVPLEGKTCVIVDDICDGGRTFLALADVLKARGASKVVLCVTHGIFSQGFDVFRGKIDHIFSTNSFQHDNLPDFVTTLKVI